MSPYPPAQTVEPEQLTPGQLHRREIGGREVHSYVFEAGERQLASISVSQQGIDVVVTVIDAEGARIRVDRPNGSRGREPVNYIAPRAGTYRLEVRTLEAVAPRGFYELTLREARPATARDESRLAAERAVSEGEVLRARKSAASLPQAVEKFGQAVALWQALDEPYETAVALYGRCLTRRMMGESAEAVADCSESAEKMRAVGDNYGEAVARTGRAWAYIYLGDVGKASADFTASLAMRRRLGDKQGEALDLLGNGWVLMLRENYEAALDHFQQSLRALDDVGDPRGRHVRLAALGEVYRRTDRPSQAVGYLTKALQLARAAGNDRDSEAETLNGIGWCRYALGDLSRAKDAFNESLAIRREVGDRTGEAATTLGLAHVDRAQGNLYNARLHVEAALAIVESLRAQVGNRPLRIAFFALAQNYYEFCVDLLMQMHRLSPEEGFAAAALEISERARARSLLDLLNEANIDVRQDVPQELLQREQTLRDRLNSAANYQQQLLSESHAVAQAAAAAKDVEDLSAALGEVEGRIRQASPRYAALTQPRTLSAAEIRREVGADTLLLEYFLGRERSFLWAVSSADVTAYELPARREIEQVAGRARDLLTTRSRYIPGETPEQRRARINAADVEYEEAAARLSRLLIAPAAAQLTAKRLVVVATGVLQLTAFGALPSPRPSNGGHQPLILSHELVILPSASTLAALRYAPPRSKPPQKLLAILADPVFSRADERFADARDLLADAALRLRPDSDGQHGAAAQAPRAQYGGPPYDTLPRLFRTRWEAEQIAALAPRGEVVQSLDFGANREAALDPAVGGSRIVHFATHAILDEEHPELSGIVLSMFGPDGRPRDGFLRAHDVFNLRLSAELVTLSACRTALGRDYKGEGLVGLARGFMYAGAPRVVGTLWPSDDKAGAELMVRFYRKMLKEGARPAAALRMAQIEMFRDGRWRSPYFWSGFVLQGEWR